MNPFAALQNAPEDVDTTGYVNEAEKRARAEKNAKERRKAQREIARAREAERERLELERAAIEDAEYERELARREEEDRKAEEARLKHVKHKPKPKTHNVHGKKKSKKKKDHSNKLTRERLVRIVTGHLTKNVESSVVSISNEVYNATGVSWKKHAHMFGKLRTFLEGSEEFKVLSKDQVLLASVYEERERKRLEKEDDDHHHHHSRPKGFAKGNAKGRTRRKGWCRRHCCCCCCCNASICAALFVALFAMAMAPLLMGPRMVDLPTQTNQDVASWGLKGPFEPSSEAAHLRGLFVFERVASLASLDTSHAYNYHHHNRSFEIGIFGRTVTYLKEGDESGPPAWILARLLNALKLKLRVEMDSNALLGKVRASILGSPYGIEEHAGLRFLLTSEDGAGDTWALNVYCAPPSCPHRSFGDKEPLTQYYFRRIMTPDGRVDRGAVMMLKSRSVLGRGHVGVAVAA